MVSRGLPRSDTRLRVEGLTLRLSCTHEDQRKVVRSEPESSHLTLTLSIHWEADMAGKAADSDMDWEGLQIKVMKRNDAP